MANRDIVARSLAAVWHPCTQMKAHERFPLVPVARGNGAWLEDFEGRRFVDGVSSWWVNLFGHSHPAINAAIADQLGSLEHAMLAGFTHEPVVELSERLAKLAPPGLGHAFYASDGASATEIALKMACHYWANRGRPGKNRVVYLEGSYHGETLGALSVTDVPAFRDAYAAIVRRNLVTPFPARHSGSREFQCENCAIEAAGALSKLLADSADGIAAIIVEPMVQGASGMRMYHPLFLRRVRELATEHEVLVIADEIMTGFGRTGTMFAWEQAFPSPPAPLPEGEGRVGDPLPQGAGEAPSPQPSPGGRGSPFLPSPSGEGSGVRRGEGSGVRPMFSPDLLCLSKGITGGYLPLSCVLSTDEIYDAFYDDSTARAFLHSHSYTGNALACRAACKVLDLFEEGRVIEANRVKAKRFDRIAAPLAAHPAVHDWRRLGMIWAFEVATDSPAFAQQAFELAMRHRALLRPIGNTVYFMPTYATDDDAFEVLVGAGTAIADTLGQRG